MSNPITEFSPGLRTGIAQIDNQHRKIFERVNQFFAACLSDVKPDEVTNLFAFLEEYVVHHFDAEEAIQVKYDYPNYEKHRKEHEAYKDRLAALRDEFWRTGINDEIHEQLNHLLIDLLMLHIGRSDRVLADYLRTKGVADEIPHSSDDTPAEIVEKIAPGSNAAEIQELLRKGLNAYGQGQDEEAVHAWRAVLKLDPDNNEALDYLQSSGIAPSEYREGDDLVARGLAHYYDGERDAAAEAWKEALERDRYNLHAQSYLEALAADGTIDGVGLPPAPDKSGQGQRESAGRIDQAQILAMMKAGRFEEVRQALSDAAKAHPRDETVKRSLAIIENRLILDYSRKLGDFSAVPVLALTPDELTKRDLNSEQGYLLYLIDGMLTVDDIMAASQLGHFKTGRYLVKMLDEKIIHYS